MITMRGKYNIANIFTTNIDETTKKQIQEILNNPAMKGGYIAIQADAHAGKGAVIGFTKQMNEYIIPNIVGVDINCGICAFNLGNIDINLQKLDEYINNEIPAGREIHKRKIYDSGYLRYLFGDRIETLCTIIKEDINTCYRSIGTLGGGNHFIEIDIDEESGEKYLVIHTGSRHLGYATANYHQQRAREILKVMFTDTHNFIDAEPLHMNHGGQSYINDIRVVADYATANRLSIARLIIKSFLGIEEWTKLPEITSIHNYIDFNRNIIRKGAISAEQDELCLIPFNMKDGTAICRGKGNPKYNYSAPHGAGRILSRGEAKSSISLDDFKKEMDGIYSTSVCQDTIDEAPQAYKNKDSILNNIKETVDVIKIIKPIYNFKARRR